MKKEHSQINIYSTFHDRNLFFPTRTIYFGSNDSRDNDVVTSNNVAAVIKNLHILECDKIAPITILLNTVGGSWNDGIIIYDLIKSLKSQVNIMGMGKVFSMGSIILQAGYKRVLTKNTDIMIHDGRDGYCGHSQNFEKWAEVSKRIRRTMYEIYYERMKEKNKQITIADIEKLCTIDSIFTAQEAVENGLADEVMEGIN